MSIRLRILVACLTLTVLTAALGLFTLAGERRLGLLALRMYDEAFMSVNFFRTAQANFMALRSALAASEPAGHRARLIARVAEDLDVAIERATSAEARGMATELRGRLVAISAAWPDAAAALRQADAAAALFERGGEQFAQDGFAFRLQAERISRDSQLTSEVAIAASLAAALLITASLTRSIVPPLRRATAIASEIAQGNLENDVTPRGSGEMVLLLGALGVMQAALAERQAAARQVEHMAHHDALTGLANRLGFSQALAQAVGEARAGAPFSLLLVDLDRFKPVNDTFGHPVGDAMLCAVARRLGRCVRDNDLVARLGGDEFAVLSRGGGARRAEQLARRIVATLAAPFELEGHRITIGASVGLDGWREGTGDAALLRNADAALYGAKAAGRGAWRAFAPPQPPERERAAPPPAPEDAACAPPPDPDPDLTPTLIPA